MMGTHRPQQTLYEVVTGRELGSSRATLDAVMHPTQTAIGNPGAVVDSPVISNMVRERSYHCYVKQHYYD